MAFLCLAASRMFLYVQADVLFRIQANKMLPQLVQVVESLTKISFFYCFCEWKEVGQNQPPAIKYKGKITQSKVRLREVVV